MVVKYYCFISPVGELLSLINVQVLVWFLLLVGFICLGYGLVGFHFCGDIRKESATHLKATLQLQLRLHY